MERIQVPCNGQGLGPRVRHGGEGLDRLQGSGGWSLMQIDSEVRLG